MWQVYAKTSTMSVRGQSSVVWPMEPRFPLEHWLRKNLIAFPKPIVRFFPHECWKIKLRSGYRVIEMWLNVKLWVLSGCFRDGNLLWVWGLLVVWRCFWLVLGF
jgi:hypothetical protein